MANYDNATFSKIGPQSDLYTRPNTRAEYQLFNNEYFTGSDVSIYLGDIWIDEIIDFEYSLQEQIMPVYGYASYVADAFVKGNRIIQGSFTINFKSVGFINEVLRYRDPIQNLYKGKNKGADLKDLSAHTLDETLKLYGVKGFEELAAEYESSLWAASDGKEDSKNGSKAYFLHYDDEDKLDDGFEIKVTYGPHDASSKVTNYKNGKKERPFETIEVLTGVHITGVQKAIASSSSGAPILERYTFVARDLNGSVSLN